jgi:hypothetical protein
MKTARVGVLNSIAGKPNLFYDLTVPYPTALQNSPLSREKKIKKQAFLSKTIFLAIISRLFQDPNVLWV